MAENDLKAQEQEADATAETEDLTPEQLLQRENEDMKLQIDACKEQFRIFAEVLTNEKKRADDMSISAARLQTEFDNYRKRATETQKRARTDGICDVLTKLIPMLDVFGRAISMVTDKKSREGLSMMARQVEELLTSYGVEEIQALGEKFDPNLHDAVGHVDAAAGGKDIVAEVLCKGYRLNDKVLRHANVIVAV